MLSGLPFALFFGIFHSFTHFGFSLIFPLYVTIMVTRPLESQINMAAVGMDSSSRYHPTTVETQILIQGLQRYFALPERSRTRNIVASEVSHHLRCLSPHWSHRAVRLWFNNNKHNYLQPTNPQLSPSLPRIEPPTAPVLIPPAPAPVRLGQSSSIGSFVVIPPFEPRVPQPPPFQQLEPVSFGNPPAMDSSASQISSLLELITQTPESAPGYLSLVLDFDTICADVHSARGDVDAQQYDTKSFFLDCPSKLESADIPARQDSELRSLSPIRDLPLRSLSYKTPAPPPQPNGGFWRRRALRQTQIRNFEHSALTDNIAVFAHLGAVGSLREISLTRYLSPNSSWRTYPVGVTQAIKSVAIDSNCAYLLTPDSICRTDIVEHGRTDIFSIQGYPGRGFLATVHGGVVAGFEGSGKMFTLSSSGAIEPFETPYRSLSCVASFGDFLLCGVSGSSVIRMMSPTAKESHVFVGHCGPVSGLTTLGERKFASSGRDATVRVWDVRYRFPVFSVATHGIPISGITGTSDFLICALENATLNVFDLRNPAGKAVMGVDTEDYGLFNLAFNQSDDALAAFGVQTTDSATPGGSSGAQEGNQGIFRVYPGFLDLH
jgi:hypothetical protein